MTDPTHAMRQRCLELAVENAKGSLNPADKVVEAARAFEAYVTGAAVSKEPTLGERLAGGVSSAIEGVVK